MDCTTFDTFETRLLTHINQSLSSKEFEELNNNKEWNEQLYLKLFLSIYVQCCELPGLTYVSVDTLLFEPVLLHTDQTMTKKNEPYILHSVSIPYLKSIFNMRNRFEISGSNVKRQLKLPSIFPIIGNIGMKSSDTKYLSPLLSERILNFYVHADHSAYHYKKFKQSGDADYEHNDIKNRSMKTRSRDIQFCHDIISTVPNKHLTSYLQSHDILSVEDTEVDDSYSRNGFSNMFEHGSSESD